MNEDTPDDVVHTRLHRGPVPRSSARARDARHARTTDRGDGAATTSPRFHAALVPARPTSSWPPPAPSTTTQVVERHRRLPAPTPRSAPGPSDRPPTRAPERAVGGAPTDRAGPRGHGWRGLRPATTPTATPWPSPTRCSAAACRAGCSRRSARSAGLAYTVFTSPVELRRRRRGRALRRHGAGAARRAARRHRRRARRRAGRRHHRRGARGGQGLPRGRDAARPRGQRQPHGPPRRRASPAAARSSRSTSTSSPHARRHRSPTSHRVLQRVLAAPGSLSGRRPVPRRRSGPPGRGRAGRPPGGLVTTGH